MSAPADCVEDTRRRRAAGIVLFFGLYVSVQIVLIGRGLTAESKHFGFWMFPESTFFVARLGRVLVEGREVRAPGGRWIVPRVTGELTSYDWRQFVNGYHLDVLERPARSKGSFSDTTRYFQAALDYVADRIPDDRETSQLVLHVEYQKAGAARRSLELRSRERLGGSHRDAR